MILSYYNKLICEDFKGIGVYILLLSCQCLAIVSSNVCENINLRGS